MAKTKAKGTSTFVMALMYEDEPFLKTLNLGDSGVMIVRPPTTPKEDLSILFRSKEQQYRFNYPFQCGTNYKPPTNADVHVHPVKPKDIVVIATDGVLDNLFNEDILQCIRKSRSTTETLDNLAASTCIAKTAEMLSFNKGYDSPFSVNAREAGRNHPGGKPDDITVIVAEVAKREDGPKL